MEKWIEEVVRRVLAELEKKRPLYHLCEEWSYGEETLLLLGGSEVFRSLPSLEVHRGDLPVLIPHLDLSTLMQVARGTCQTSYALQIMEALAFGVPLVVHKEDVAPLKTSFRRTPYTQQFVDALDLLTASGLEILGQEASLTKEDEKPPIKEGGAETDQTLITEKDLSNWYRQGIREMTIGEKTLITPLARDYLRHHPMALTRRQSHVDR